MRTARLHSLDTFVLSAAFVLLLLSVLLFWRFGSPVLFFLPAALFAIPILGRRLLSNPVPVLFLFLLFIVNLDFFRLGEPGGVRLTVDILTSLALLYALMVRLGLERRRFLQSGVEKAYLAYVLVTFISVLASVNIVFSFKNWVRDLEYLFLFYLITGLGASLRDRKRLVAAILLSSLVPCFTALLGQIFKIPAFYGLESPVGGGETVFRVQGTLGHPGILGHYLSMVAILALGLIIDGRWYPRRFLVPLFSFIVSILYLSYSRTGWVEFMVGVPVLFWIMGHRRTLLRVLPLVVVGIPLFLPTFLARWQNAILSAENNSFLWRVGLWLFAIAKFPERPILGSGPDTFNEYISYSYGFNAHNTWLNLLIEQGIVGFVVFTVLMIVVARTLYRKMVLSGPERDPLLAGTFAIWVSFMAGAWAGLPFELPVVTVYFWTLVALAVGTRVQNDTTARPG
jgi:O-antigen ligase